MTRIGLLSDTHAYWDEKYLEYFEPCDEIWHAGDIGSLEVAEKLAAFRPLRAVYGNIDGQEIRKLFPAGEPFYGGRCGSTHKTHRRLSGKVRSFHCRKPDDAAAETLYQRALSYIKGEI